MRAGPVLLGAAAGCFLLSIAALLRNAMGWSGLALGGWCVFSLLALSAFLDSGDKGSS